MNKFYTPLFDFFFGTHAGPRQAPTKVIVGLGNPGSHYASTRHNAGFWCVERLAVDHRISFSRRHRTTSIGEGKINGHVVVLAKPRTFMNHSGEAVAYLMARYKITANDLFVIYDDMSLSVGTLRVRPNGGGGGHKGVASIIDMIGTKDFPRLRIGIGHPKNDMDQVAYVLGTMPEDEKNKMDDAVTRASQVVSSIMEDGITVTMNQFNGT